ncbi:MULTISPECIES: CaiB/BaiF CoA-transferase family protein [unclassified Acinetobacter]|uniref:CaiB/BaiF CoA transferase family protein n=1 Tax=unclassified Acinetobacter TaxID=196816 RepID=UPI0029352F82|nr:MULTISPECIES: CaiB/BaiF CoA-transferase family protein [unclassified Acinetobacter]WOE32949.1 CaiB/BaiF CoA-transferase family protein [Acinetobacter sp. SAAs470]WOE38426.1 CaiB/BaiF CoA-transferase family protein [Acinetobacter sp. SAAs474]
MLPLNNITVIALEHAIAAPFCTRQLADLGARVIKIERPNIGDFARNYDERVDGISSHFVWANRSKESLTLDIKTQAAQDILKQLVLKADVLVQNLAPDSASRLGLSFEELSTINPQIIVCDISGYGDDLEHSGPYRDKKAYDLLIQSEAGFLSITGTPDEYIKAGCSIADIAAGMYAYTNILSALLERQQTGKGKRIDISMLESMAEWMGYPLYYTLRGGSAPPRTGSSHATIYPYGPFPTGDNKKVMLGIQNEREWKAFCKIVLEQPQLALNENFINNLQRSKNRDQLKQIIIDTFNSLTQTQVIERLDVAKIANASVNEMQNLWHHPQLEARQRWTLVNTPIGEIPTLKPVGRKDEDYKLSAVPALSEHTHKILHELGYSEIYIHELTEKSII